jgi:methionyl-tRNA synthetase
MVIQIEKEEKWIVTSAWPYASDPPHLGNLIGSTLSADAFARFLRSKGNEVVFVSGSDTHGTPVAVEAIKRKIPTKDVALMNHQKIKDLHEQWKISFDNYTLTHNPVHIQFVQRFYLDIQKNNFIVEKEIDSLYCEVDNLYLPDRFVEGTCPNCDSDRARGDQCDTCGKLLTPLELINPRCSICGNKPKIKTTKHWYLDFPKLQSRLKKFIEQNEIIPSNARQMCLNSIEDGIPQRAITRDLEWGIPAPFEGAGDKTIYVWFEAVLGYISAILQWAEEMEKDSTKFDYFWKDPKTKSVFFIGKDNIIFHLIIFPGLLMAYNEDKKKEEQLILPYNVSSTEWLLFENEKFSKSRGVGIYIDEALQLAPLDYWRFNLLFNRPESSDTSFLWSEFENTIKILNDTIGNFIHRTLTFVNKQFNSKIPEKLEYDEIDKSLVEKINNISSEISDSMLNFKIRKALRDIVNFGREGNVYLNEKAPWHLIKTNKKAAGHVFNICCQVVYALAILLEPFIPDTSEKILTYLNLNSSDNFIWDSINENSVKAGLQIKKPQPLFQKLDIKQIQEEYKKLKSKEIMDEKRMISYEEFKKLDIRVGLVEEVEKVPNADKLYKIKVDLGGEKRTLVAGLAEFYEQKELIGKKIVMLANLEPRKMRGITSQGMLLAAVEGKVVSVLTPDKDLPSGAKIE